MSVRIGHASIDERGRAVGGASGDQTKKEVCVRSWYNHKWQFVLRCVDANKAELMARACEKGCANDLIGYDQSNRNSLNTQAKKVGYDLSKVSVACECDCSSFMTVCAQSAGINIRYYNGNAPATSTMSTEFLASGMFVKITDSKYLTSDKYLKRGDILVKAGSHTAMVLDNGELSTTQDTTKHTKVEYKVGVTYTTTANLNVRVTPNGEKKLLSELTKNAKANAYDDGNGCAILRKGTRVTCQGVSEVNKQTWLKIPSGYICAINNGKVYIK